MDATAFRDMAETLKVRIMDAGIAAYKEGRTVSGDELCEAYKLADKLADKLATAASRWHIRKLRQGVREVHPGESYIRWQVLDRADVESALEAWEADPKMHAPESLEDAAIHCAEIVRPVTPPASYSPTGRWFNAEPSVRIGPHRVLVQQWNALDC